MTRDEVKQATRLIEQAICKHMPSAAVATGWLSENTGICENWVKQMCERFPYSKRPENLGMSGLRAWLVEHGITAGDEFIRVLRATWIADCLRVETGGQATGQIPVGMR